MVVLRLSKFIHFGILLALLKAHSIGFRSEVAQVRLFLEDRLPEERKQKAEMENR